MKQRHLSEEEIQQYALVSPVGDQSISDHLATCEACKLQLENYKILFSGIRQERSPAFGFNLAEMVVAQLPAVKPRSSSDNIFVLLFVFVALMLTGGALFYFRIYLAGLFTSITPFIFYLVATAAITIMLIIGVDMYKTYQKKMNALEFY